MVHPMLSLRQIASIDLPKYSDSGDLYDFAAAISHWVDKHEMKKWKYSQMDRTNLYLDHLDENHYTLTVDTCRHTLLHVSDDPPAPYVVIPTIATNISQLVDTRPIIEIDRHHPTPHTDRISDLRDDVSRLPSPEWVG